MADKLPSLDGLIQTKGASRPEGSSNPVRMLQAAIPGALAQAEREPRAKSLTLRLSESQYERLRRFAFDQRLSHQDIIERALIEHLDKHAR